MNELQMFVYYRKGAEGTHAGLVMAHDIEEAKRTMSFPKTLINMIPVGDVVELTRVNSTEIV